MPETLQVETRSSPSSKGPGGTSSTTWGKAGGKGRSQLHMCVYILYVGYSLQYCSITGVLVLVNGSPFTTFSAVQL